MGEHDGPVIDFDQEPALVSSKQLNEMEAVLFRLKNRSTIDAPIKCMVDQRCCKLVSSRT